MPLDSQDMVVPTCSARRWDVQSHEKPSLAQPPRQIKITSSSNIFLARQMAPKMAIAVRTPANLCAFRPHLRQRPRPPRMLTVLQRPGNVNSVASNIGVNSGVNSITSIAVLMKKILFVKIVGVAVCRKVSTIRRLFRRCTTIITIP